MRPALFALLLAVPPDAPPSDAELHRRAIVIDTHADSTQRIADGGIDFGKRQPDMQEDLPKMKQGGLDAQFFSIWVDPEKIKPPRYYADSLRQLDAVHRMIRSHPEAIAWAKTAADVRRNAARGLISALFGVEGGHSLAPGSEAEQLGHLRTFYERGARYLTLTWSNSNALGGSSGDDGEVTGLTDFGRRVIEDMQRLGMMVDLSHVSDPLFWDAIRAVKRPVLLSHSSARALANHPRNVSDAMLKAVARNGGAVCVNYFAGFLDDGFARAIRPIWDKYKGVPLMEAERKVKEEVRHLPQVPLARLVDHIDHMVKVAGVDHVCLGSDFDGITALPVGLEDVSKLPALTSELVRRGYAPADVEKILGGNVLRVLEANEARPPQGGGR